MLKAISMKTIREPSTSSIDGSIRRLRKSAVNAVHAGSRQAKKPKSGTPTTAIQWQVIHKILIYIPNKFVLAVCGSIRY